MDHFPQVILLKLKQVGEAQGNVMGQGNPLQGDPGVSFSDAVPDYQSQSKNKIL